MAVLASARYGKDNVRVYKVDRDEKTGVQTVTEMTVCALVEGEVDASYTDADNSSIVATDSIKNTIYIKAKEFPVTTPEYFASALGSHFVDMYKHIHAAHIKIITHRWTRMTIDGKAHPHSFFRDGNETRVTEVAVHEGKGIQIRSGISGLLVLKSTGSQFHGFVRDEFTTLPEVWDRILSTEVDSVWNWRLFKSLEQVESYVPKFDKAWSDARDITMKLFAEENSPSVQNTMYKMCEKILGVVPDVETVEYSLPNKHYFEIDLSFHNGLKNTKADATVYAPQSGPNGLIKCTVGRQNFGKSKL